MGQLEIKKATKEDLILSIMVYTFNSYKEDNYAARGIAA